MAVALDDEGVGHLDRTDLCDAANVVARQVDQHHVLGAFLGVANQLHLGSLIQLGRGAARAGACQRPDGHFGAGCCPHACHCVCCAAPRGGPRALGRPGAARIAVDDNLFLAHQNLRRRAHHVEIAEVVEIHVRAGVQRAQRAVQAQGRGGVALLDALAHLHLHEVTPGNHLLGAHHGRNVIGLGKVALGCKALRGFDVGRAHRLGQLGLEFRQARLARSVGIGCGRVHIDHQVQLARQVVDDGQLFALQQQDVGRAQLVGRAAGLQLFLDVAHGVVAKVAGQAAAKARHAGLQRHLETLLVLGDEVQRVGAGGFHHHAIGDDFGAGIGAKTAGAQQGAGGQANKAVAAKALAAHHRFQQKAVGGGLGGTVHTG